MGKLIISLHISLDGFVAGTNGEMEWIGIEEAMFDYVGSITERSETACYGRKTFELMDGYWPTAAEQPNATRHDHKHSAWYNKVDKIILSNTMMGKDHDKIHFVNEAMLPEAIAAAKQKGNIACFGSPSAIHTLLAKDLVDEIYLFINPVLLGAGIPLFKGISNRSKWKLQETRTFLNGNIASLHYTRADS